MADSGVSKSHFSLADSELNKVKRYTEHYQKYCYDDEEQPVVHASLKSKENPKYS